MSSLLSITWYKPILRIHADNLCYEGQVCCRKEIQEGQWPTTVGSSENELGSNLLAGFTRLSQISPNYIVYFILKESS